MSTFGPGFLPVFCSHCFTTSYLLFPFTRTSLASTYVAEPYFEMTIVART